MFKFIKLSIFIGLFAFVFAFASVVDAVEDNATTTAVETTTEKATDRAEKAADRLEAKTDRMEAKAEKLSEARLKTCEARADKINSRFSNMKSLGSRSHDTFESFVTKVDNFYKSKLALAGHPLDNYNALMSEISTNKAAVAAALAEVKANGQEFSCDSDDPKGHATVFRESMQDLIVANKAYKQSVRAFVSAVRDLAKEAKAARLNESSDATPSAELETDPAGSDTSTTE